MDDTSLPINHEAAHPGGLSEVIAQGRQQARDYLSRQQRRLGEFEAVLAHEIGQVSHQISLSHQANLQAQAELAEGRDELDAATKKLRLDERGLAQLRRECEANAEELAYQRQRAQQKLTELDAQRNQLDRLETDLKRRRRRLAHEIMTQRQDIQRELARRQSEVDRHHQATGENEALTQQLAAAKQRVAELERGLAEANQRQQQDDVQGELREALANMARRYELAMEDLREQQRRVAELEQQPARAPAAAAVEDTGKLDWESQKQRMLAALEADDEDADEDRQQERLKIRDVLARTEEALAAKDQQIAELEKLLAAQSTNIGEVAVGAAAFADLLASDEVVLHERERLQQLQREWEEKLRQAEIELSVQRAKLARERADIEDRQRSLHDSQADHGRSSSGPATTDGKAPRGRWLARLGLKDDGT